MRGIDPSAERFLADLGRVSARIGRAQARLSSGLKVTRPSDSPLDVPRIIEIQESIDRADQVQQNLVRVKVEADAGERSVASALTLLDRVATLGSQGASTGSAPASRQALQSELASIEQQLVVLANTRVDGRYVFAGDADLVAPYLYDPLSPTAVSSYGGQASTRQVEDIDGGRFPVARTAQEIFDDPNGASVFAAVEAMRAALAADDPQAAADALPAIQTARDHISSQLVFYGTVQNEVAAATDTTYKRKLQFKESLAGVREVDLVEEALELQQAQTQQSASLAARGRFPRTSLFDYIG